MVIVAAHMVNHGQPAGSAAVAQAIRASGHLIGGEGWSGYGVYAHFIASTRIYLAQPHIVFSAEVDDVAFKTVPSTTGDFIYIALARYDDLRITVLCEHNTR